VQGSLCASPKYVRRRPRHMLRRYFVPVVEVSYGSRNFGNTVHRPRRKRVLVDDSPIAIECLISELAKLANPSSWHSRIEGDLGATEALVLSSPRPLDSRPVLFTQIGIRLTESFIGCERLQVNLEIDSIENRPGDLLLVLLHFLFRTPATKFIAVESARAGVHWRDKCESAWIFDGDSYTGNPYATLFHGLSEAIEGLFTKFCNLV